MKHIISEFKPSGGKHCITNSIKQIFQFYGHPISEEMLLGIGSGLYFAYLNMAAGPIIAGRSKPFEFEAKIARRFHIQIKCKRNKDNQKVFVNTIKMLNDNNPVQIYVDMPYLEYLNMDTDCHFGGHSVILFGYDDSIRSFYVSDRDNHDFILPTPKGDMASDYHIVNYDEIQKARSSNYRPFPANNKYMQYDFSEFQEISISTVVESILETCETMLNAPVSMLGLNGILKFSKEVLKWNKFDPEKLNHAGKTNYFQIKADGGTGGGMFRKMYGQFLLEACDIVQNSSMESIGVKLIEISKQWDQIADYMWQLSESKNLDLLNIMSDRIKELHKKESSVFLELKNTVYKF